MKIGNIETKNNVFLAPMAGITDKVFRLICKEWDCGLVYSEMVSAKGMSYNNRNTHQLLEIDENERPTAIQIFGSDPVVMGEMAKRLNDFDDVDIIDINMGCPAPKIVRNGEGSALTLKPDLVADIIASVSGNSKKPVTVKFRKGFNNSNINAVEIAKIAEKNGAAAVTVHGRTREQYYSGKADWDIIKDVKKALNNIPLIGNGDIVKPEDAKAMIEHTGCDAVMIGRAAQGNPFIFKRTAHYLETGELLPEPTWEEKLDTAKKHLDMLAEYKGEYIGVREMRKHISWYIKGIPHCAEMRVKIMAIENRGDMHKLIDEMRGMLK
jgi:nifR3 family TIM-barrel protein